MVGNIPSLLSSQSNSLLQASAEIHVLALHLRAVGDRPDPGTDTKTIVPILVHVRAVEVEVEIVTMTRRGGARTAPNRGVGIVAAGIAQGRERRSSSRGTRKTLSSLLAPKYGRTGEITRICC